MKKILEQLKEYKKYAILTPLFASFEVMMEVLLPFVTALIIDQGLAGRNLERVYLYGSVMVAMALVSLLFGVLSGRFAARASAGLAHNLREGIYSKVQEFSFSNIDKYSTAGLVTRMTTDVTNIQNAFQMTIRVAVRSPLMLVFSMIMCFIISVKLSLMFLVGIAFLASVLAIIMTRASKIYTKVFDQYDEVNASVQENVDGIRVVKAYVRENHENKKFERAALLLCKLSKSAEKLLAFNSPAMMLVVYGCIITLSWFGAHLIVGGEMSTGQLTSLYTYIMMIMMALMMLSMVIVMLSMSTASTRRIAQVLNDTADIQNPENPIMVVENGDINFDHVSFAYSKDAGEDVLNDIDLKIKSGETVGIIGTTGSGKTSLINLISRLYDVTDGSVSVGGRDVREYDLETLRDNVSVVLQKNVLFSGTILDNLRWGKPNSSEEECIQVCKIANADEFIERMPHRYHSRVERGGSNFSGGQKQRLCIARALLKDPKVLILDDSTSAVDTATDAKIREGFKQIIPGVTKIIIAQRIASVENSDRIIVLESGQVSAFDTHDNLLKSSEIYKELFDSQTKGGGDFDHKEKTSEVNNGEVQDGTR